MRFIIVDANKVLAAFIKKGIVHDTLFSGKFKPVGPEKLLFEVNKHTPLISSKSGISVEDVKNAVSLFVPEFKIFSRDEYANKLSTALKISPHPKDVEYFALALKIDCGIWSNEKSFKNQSRVKVYSTPELVKELGIKP